MRWMSLFILSLWAAAGLTLSLSSVVSGFYLMYVVILLKRELKLRRMLNGLAKPKANSVVLTAVGRIGPPSKRPPRVA